MIKILIAVIVVIIMFLVNKMCMKKNKYFFPIIPFIISCVIIGISIFQIVQKENEYAADEIQPVAIEEIKTITTPIIATDNPPIDSLSKPSFFVLFNCSNKRHTRKMTIAIKKILLLI